MNSRKLARILSLCPLPSHSLAVALVLTEGDTSASRIPIRVCVPLVAGERAEVTRQRVRAAARKHAEVKP